MATNSQYSSPGPLFAGQRFDSTGAPGSPGLDPDSTTGEVVGTPVVSNPYGSSQLPGNRPTLAVDSGDTSGMSDDVPAHSSVIAPGPQDQYMSTSAGTGRTTTRHPNAGQ